MVTLWSHARRQAQFIVHEPPGSVASLAPLLEWMTANLRADLSLEALARHAGTSARTLGRRFREQTGTTPLQWVIAARVRRAASTFAHFATDNAALLEVMNSTKHRPGASDIPRAAEAAYAPIVDLIRHGQAAGELRAGEPEEIGLVLFATMNGIATLVNTAAIDAERLDDLTDAAVDQFLTGTSWRP